jgi:leucyl aminopeptidase
VVLKNFASRGQRAVPLELVRVRDFAGWHSGQSAIVQRWLKQTGFNPTSGRHALLPSGSGELVKVVAVVSNHPDLWDYARLPRALPARTFAIDSEISPEQADDIALGWALGTYNYTRYKKSDQTFATLFWPRAADRARVSRLAEGVALCRDLINTPASDMGPQELAAATAMLAAQHGAKCTAIVGQELVKRNYPAIHAVGRASDRAPRLLDLRWGNARQPKLTLVGKGVCFDTGGLDLKPASNMLLMKKDMGGAATVLGLAHCIMSEKLPVRLRVLIPAVENSVSGNAFRPLDVLSTRKGLTVEVGNTDAEGRLVLADALAEADSERPDLLIDVATLTGAARVALGTKLPALFCNSDKVAKAVLEAGERAADPLWRLPLHQPYKKLLHSSVADLTNLPSGPYGGAITAALFLQHFVGKRTPWIHIDTMAYNQHAAPGRPVGGEAMSLRALSTLLTERYAKAKASRARARKG